jgi:hypothetical protein
VIVRYFPGLVVTAAEHSRRRRRRRRRRGGIRVEDDRDVRKKMTATWGF